MLYKFGFKCWSSLTYLDPELSRMSKTALITSWRLQRSILQEETQRKVESKTNFKRSALTKPKPTSLFLCYHGHSAAVFLHSPNDKEIQKTKTDWKICSQNPSANDFKPQSRHKTERLLSLGTRKVVHRRQGLKGSIENTSKTTSLWLLAVF